MGIIAVTEDTHKSPSSASTEGLRVVGNYTRTWRIDFTTNVSIAQQQVLSLTAPGIPGFWVSHPYDPWAHVSNKSSAFETGNSRIVTVNYSATEDPFAQDPVVSYTGIATSEPIDRDKDGAKIGNTNGESFDPPINEDFSDSAINYNHNWQSFDPLQAADFRNKINSATFLGFPPKCVLIKEFSGEPLRAGSIFYWNVTIVFHIRYDANDETKSTWARRIVNEGFLEKKVTDGDIADEATEVLDTNGNKVSSPVALKEDGTRVPEGEEIHLLSFDTKHERNFAVLPIT